MPETSARLPADTKVEMPMPRWATRWSSAVPSAPDWLKKPTRPRPGRWAARVAFRRTAGSVLAMPRQLGPTTRKPYARAMRTRSSWRARPSGPVSPKPDETTTRPFTPFSAHSSTTSSTASAGTATTARSTSPSMAETLLYARTPATALISLCTGYTGPLKSAPRRLRSTVCPMPPASRPAPTTTTEVGVSSRPIERASARCSLAVVTSREVSVVARSRVMRTTPSSNWLCAVYPAWRKKAIMRLLDGSTSAMKRLMPCSRAAARRCSMSTEATPLPWCASSTRNATSALSCWSIRSKRTTATISVPRVAMRATRFT